MTKKKKKILLIVIGVLVVAVVAMNLLNSGPKGKEVQVTLADVGDISSEVSASGRVQPQTSVNITSQVSAEVVALYVNEGDYVKKGQKLIQLDTVQLESDVQQMRYSLDETTARSEASRVQMEQDREEYKRQSALFEKKLTSETAFTNAKYTFENSQASYNAMQSQVKTQRARLDKALDQLSKTTITAPMDGIITSLATEVGEIAQAQTSFTQGQTLMTVANLSVFEVDVEVDETEIAKINIGQEAKIEVDAFPDSVFTGRVVEIGNSAILAGQGTSEFSVNFRVKVRFDPTTARILPGMSATVDITAATERDVILVPYASLVMREPKLDSSQSKSKDTSDGALVGEVNASESTDKSSHDSASTATDTTQKTGTSTLGSRVERITGVFVVRDGVAKFVAVDDGIADERNVVALSGVQKGDTIISGSFQTLRDLQDGDQVTIDPASLEALKSGNNRMMRRATRGTRRR